MPNVLFTYPANMANIRKAAQEMDISLADVWDSFEQLYAIRALEPVLEDGNVIVAWRAVVPSGQEDPRSPLLEKNPMDHYSHWKQEVKERTDVDFAIFEPVTFVCLDGGFVMLIDENPKRNTSRKKAAKRKRQKRGRRNGRR